MKSAPKKPSGAELRLLREQRVQELTDPVAEARRREEQFLSHLGQAQNHFQWIVRNQAWKHLGFESFAEWWAGRVRPAMSALSMEPTREFAVQVLAEIEAEEALLPRSQRRSKRELAGLVPTGEWTARGRQDRDKRRRAAGADLEGVIVEPSPLTEALTQAITETEQTAAERRMGDSADGVEDQVDLRSDEAPAAGDAVRNAASPAVTPEDSPAGRSPSSDMSVRSLVATHDQPEFSHPYAGEAAAEAGASLAADAAEATPPAAGPAGEGPAVVSREDTAAGHPDRADHLEALGRLFDAIGEVLGIDAFAIAQSGNQDTFDLLLDAADDLAEHVLKVQQARIEYGVDRRS